MEKRSPCLYWMQVKDLITVQCKYLIYGCYYNTFIKSVFTQKGKLLIIKMES